MPSNVWLNKYAGKCLNDNCRGKGEREFVGDRGREEMARPTGLVAEKNPFLTGTVHVPATALSEKLGLSPVSQYSPKKNQDEESLSEGSECTEEYSQDEHEVDEFVAEEMAKLENTFEEIGLKFRLIDRIGEGKLYAVNREEFMVRSD